MKKITALLSFILLMQLNNSFAQGVQFGGKVGTDINKLSGESFSNKFSFGYHAGAYAQIELSKVLSFQPELYYSEVSFDTATSFSSIYQFSSISKVKFGYINVPLLLNIKPSKSFSIQVGPKFGLLTNSNLAISPASIINSGRDAIKNGDLSMVGGVQFYFTSFRLYGRYQIGLTELNDIDKLDKWKSQSIHIGIALRIF